VDFSAGNGPIAAHNESAMVLSYEKFRVTGVTGRIYEAVRHISAYTVAAWRVRNRKPRVVIAIGDS
jgi:hypothetical protein